MGDDRRRCVALAEQGEESVGREDLGHGERKFLSEKPGVVSEDDLGLESVDRRLGIGEFRLQVVRDSLGGEADVFKGEVARDEPAPSGGPKLDRGHVASVPETLAGAQATGSPDHPDDQVAFAERIPGMRSHPSLARWLVSPG
jgi:hypothetical protein